MKSANNHIHGRAKKAPSVKLSVFAAFLIFTTVTLLLSWLFQVVFLENIYKSFRIMQIEKDAQLIARQIASGENYEVTAGNIAIEHNMCISIMSPSEHSITRLTDTLYKDCHLYFLSVNECETLYNRAAENEGSSLVTVFRDGKGRYTARDYSLASSDEMHSVIYTLVCKNQSGETIALMLNSVITPVGASVQTMTALLCGISVILVVFAVILALFVSRKVTKPIIDICEKTKQFAAGDYSVRFDTRGGYKEINELSATLNYTGSELSKVENLRRELISNISHDLRTPLTLIKGYSEVMRDIPGKCTPENFQTVIDETDRLSSIVSEMLDYSKIESGTYEPSFESLDISELIKNTVDTYRELTAKNGYNIQLSLCPATVIQADKNMTVRAILNLINNAVTHTGEQKDVQIRESINGSFVRIEVTDSGRGIPENQLELIWERYYKADSEHKRAALGSGLGLSIVKSVMVMHKGKFGVRSREGFGSTFWIEFPIL